MELLTIDIPKNCENMQLPNPDLLEYWALAENRIFYIDTEIDEDTMFIQKEIINFNIIDKGIPKSDRKPIIILLNTPGGNLQETMSICQSIIMSKTPVITVNVGSAYSGGALILLAGHKRYAMKYSKAMIHTGGVSGLSGTYEQTEAAQKNYKKQIDEMGQYILERSKIDEKTFKRNKSKDWFFDEDEQISYGLVDKNLESFDEIF